MQLHQQRQLKTQVEEPNQHHFLEPVSLIWTLKVSGQRLSQTRPLMCVKASTMQDITKGTAFSPVLCADTRLWVLTFTKMVHPQSEEKPKTTTKKTLKKESNLVVETLEIPLVLN